MEGPKPLLTEFGIHHILESCVCEQLKITNSLYQKQSCLSEHNRADRLISRNINLALKITATCLQHDIPKYQERNKAHPQKQPIDLECFFVFENQKSIHERIQF